MRKMLLSIVLLAWAAGVSAQWSENPAVNNRVTPSNVSFYESVALTNQNGVSYFFYVVPSVTTNGDDAFQYRMQILNADGQNVYGAAGKIISQERNITWTKFNDYIVLDREGNCIVSCFDLRESAADKYDFNYYISKISPTGEVLWGPVALNGGKSDENMTGLSICATDDGGSAFAYTVTGSQASQRVTHLERIDSDGHLLWQQPVEIEPQSTTTRPLLVSNGQNQLMVLYQDESSQYVARVFDAEGNDVWGESVVVYTGGFSSDKVYPSLRVQSGPEGGVVFSVMDGGWDGRFIYMNREGEYVFSTANVGTRVAGSDNQSTVPSVYYDAEEKAFYAAFTNMETYGYGGYGVNLQKFSANGIRQWGDEGVSIVPTQTGQQIANVTLRSAGRGRVAVFYQYMGSTAYNDPVATYVTVIDSDGKTLVEPHNVTTSAYVKSNLSVSPLVADNHYVVSWTEQRSTSTSSCIYAQYVSIDGSTTTNLTAIAPASVPQAIFSLSGIRLQQPEKGINIIRGNGATTKRVMK